MSALSRLPRAVIVILIILSILTLVGVIFANGVSVLFATSILLGFFLVVICGLSIFFGLSFISADTERKIEKFDLLGRLRRFLVSKGGFSIPEIAQRITILVMSAASVAIIVRAVIFVVKAMNEFAKTQSWDNMDWLLDLMSDIPVLNIMVLMKQGFETDFRADFFVAVLLASLVVMGIAAAIAQVLMTFVYRVIFKEATEGALPFRILSVFSMTTLTVIASMFVCRLFGLLLDFSKMKDVFADFCKPLLSSSVGNFLLQVLVTFILFALVLLICYDWVQDIVMGIVGFILWFAFQIIQTSFLGGDNNVTNTFVFLLGILFPIVDFIKNYLLKNDKYKWLPVAVPLALSVVISTVATFIDKAKGLCQTISVPVACIGILVYVAYLFATPVIDIAVNSRAASKDDRQSSAAE